MEKSGLRNAAEIVLLIGAILETVGHAILIFCTVFIWTPFAAVIIPLLWVARSKALKGSKGWNIYGIVHGTLTGWVTLAGHIMLLIDNNSKAKVQATQVAQDIQQ